MFILESQPILTMVTNSTSGINVSAPGKAISFSVMLSALYEIDKAGNTVFNISISGLTFILHQV
jgi:hypothetical protein